MVPRRVPAIVESAMKVFISWSGQLSLAVAELLHDWLKCVLQVSEPWLSSRDIDRGALWFTEINNQLKDTSVGIICLTHENKNKPWLLFEAGALAKGLSSSRVCTLLINLKPTDLGDPLAQFNHTQPDKTSIKLLVLTLNSLCTAPLAHNIVERVFETYWAQFEAGFKKAIKENPVTEQAAEPKDANTMLERIYESTMSLNQRIAKLEIQSTSASEAEPQLEVQSLGAWSPHQRRLRPVWLWRNAHLKTSLRH